MYRKSVGLISFVLLLGLAGSTFGAQAYTWDDGDVSLNHYWSSPNNWDPNGNPGLTDTDTVGITGPLLAGRQWCTMPNDVNVTIAGFGMSGPRNPGSGFVGDPCLVMYGRLVVQPGLIIIGSGYPGGVDNTGTVHLMTGSNWRTQRDPLENTVNALWTTQQGGDGTIVMDGGTWVADGVTLSFNSGGGGTLRLNGGTFKTYFFEMLRGFDPWLCAQFYPGMYITTCRSNMDIRQGTMIIDGDRTDDEIPYEKYAPYERSRPAPGVGYTAPYYLGIEDIGVNGYVNRGWITAYGQPNDPCDPNNWYLPENDTNNWWMPKRARVIVQYNPTGEMVVQEADHTGHTIVTAYMALSNGEAYDLDPAPYAVDVDPKVTLTWKPGDYVRYGGDYNGIPNAQKGNGHHVFIHTKFDTGWGLGYPVGTATGHIVGAQDANSFSIEANYPGGALKLDTTYYWCVIEANDHNVAPIQWTYKSLVQRFRTLGGKASNPNPGTGSEVGLYIGEPCNLLLSWKRGFYAAGTNGHKVYFGTDYSEVNDVNTQYQTTTTEPNWLATNLELGKTYYWRIDEVSTTGPDPNWWKGDTWSFKVGKYRVVDAFDSDGSDNDLRARWKDAYLDGSACALWGTGEELYSDIGGQSKRGMRFEYDNNDRMCAGPAPCGYSYFSEARLEYASGKNWTYGDGSTTLKTLALSYKGAAGNQVYPADPNLDKMYVAVESTNGKMAIVWNEDPNTQQKTGWQEWNILLSDFNEINDVNVASVKYLYIGFGVRCDPESGVRGLPGGEGKVVFDNIRLYPRRCVGLPGFRMLGDLGGGATSGLGDCDVNMADVKVLVSNWLMVDRLSGVPVPVAGNDPCLLVRYEFENTWANDANGRVGAAGDGVEVNNPTFVYDSNRAGYVAYFPQADTNDIVLCGTWGQDGNFAGKSFSIVFWAKQKELSNETSGWGDMVSKGESYQKVELLLANQPPQLVHYVSHGGGVCVSASKLDLNKWYHIAATYQQFPDANGGMQRLYINGRQDGQGDMNEVSYNQVRHSVQCAEPNWALGAQQDEGNTVSSPPAPISIQRPFHGYLDDVRVYDRRLTEEEIMYITGYYGPTVKNYYPIADPNIYSDIYSPEAPGSKAINFKDLAKLAECWMFQDIWWPPDDPATFKCF
jgi:hypothetical protein